MFCNECGTKNDEGSKFCSSCGNQLYGVNGTERNVYQSNNNNMYENNNNSKGSPVFAILGWIANAVSLLVVPIFFAAVGISLGYAHKKVNNTHGTIIMIAGVACGLFGMMFGAYTALL